MESACSVVKGPLFTSACIIRRPQKPSRGRHHVSCNNGLNCSDFLSAKCANLSSLVTHVQKHLVLCRDPSVGGLPAATLTLTDFFTKGESGRGRALAISPFLGMQFRGKVSELGRCGCKQCYRVLAFSSSGVSSFGLDLNCGAILDNVSRRAARQEKKQILTKGSMPTVLSFCGQLGTSAAQGFGKTQMSRTLCEFHAFPVLGRGKRRQRGGYRHVCEASSQEDKGQTEPDDENSEGASEQNPAPVPNDTGDVPGVSPPELESHESDWRTFRARLVVSEQQASETSETEASEGKAAAHSNLAGTLAQRWAHPILAPETGCVLIATDKIDGQQSFERSVILLLSPGSTNPREGPYGLILNRPLSCRIKDIKPKDRTLVKFFGNCQVHHGGPLDEDMFLLLHGTEGVRGYREVIPGVYYGDASGLEEIMRGRRPLDYRFFFGYSGWSVDQLKREIEQGLWCVAACSTDLITGHSAAGLWEEILLLMGGKYAELSERPRRKHF